MRLISVERDELAIGQPLRWTLYDQQRHVLMERGEVIANGAQLRSVLNNSPLREAAPAEATSDTPHEDIGQGVHLP